LVAFFILVLFATVNLVASIFRLFFIFSISPQQINYE
jgi:hypothetical protein